MVFRSQNHVGAHRVVLGRAADKGDWRHPVAFDVHADIDSPINRLTPAHIVLALSLVELTQDLACVDLLLLSLIDLAELGDLLETPVNLPIVHLMLLLRLLLLLKHCRAELVPWERLHIGGLLGVELFLETDIEASLQEVGLHLLGSLQGVSIYASSLDFELFHVFLRSNRLIIQSGRASLICWISECGRALLFEDLQRLVLPNGLEGVVAGVHL